ncbi:MAG: hypothetical protein ACR2NN_09275 [Bryobacteraceae bacterium]
MSRYRHQPIELTGLNTIPIQERGGKVQVKHFAKPYEKSAGIRSWLDSLPDLLAGEDFRAVVKAFIRARQSRKAIIWGLGGHVIKCGLAPVLIDLMKDGYATAFAVNGAAAIHDFEIAIAGQTSEDVEAVLPDGRFGTAEETGREMNDALTENETLGFGEALGLRLQAIADSRYAPCSLLHAAYQANVPVTVHVAIGTDTPHTHPAASGPALGRASHQDFRLLCSLVRDIHDGGVYLNVGSAVVLPEVFLKAVSVVRNLGHPLADFTTANFDFIQHYRPRTNVVQRPHAGSHGKGYTITGHHEIMIPLLAATLIESGA